MKKPLIGIIMGSDSDLPIMSEAAIVLEELDIPFEIDIISAHRTPQKMYQYANSAVKKGLKVIIAGAGGAAHLPGMTAAMTPLPVIGVPVKGKNLEGLDSLLSIVQMPPGIPVATVAINGAKNAGILAAQIVGSSNPEVLKRVADYTNDLQKAVQKKSAKLIKIGYQDYFEEMKNGSK